MMPDKSPTEPEQEKTYETIPVIDGQIDAAPVDGPWYVGLIFERIGIDRSNVDHWVAHLTLGNNTTHMPMRVFLSLQKLLGEVKHQ